MSVEAGEIATVLEGALRPRGRADPLDIALARTFGQIGDERGIAVPHASARSGWILWALAGLGANRDAVVSGQNGWDLLSNAQAAVRTELEIIAQRQSLAVWLAATRRLLTGPMTAFSAPIRAALTAPLVWAIHQSRVTGKEGEFTAAVVKPSKTLIDCVSDLLALASIHKNVHAALLRVGKGQEVIVGGDGWLFRWEGPPLVAQAIALHDARLAERGGDPGPHGYAGGVVGSDWTETSARAWVCLHDQRLLPADHLRRFMQTCDAYFPVVGQLEMRLPVVTKILGAQQPQSVLARGLLNVGWRYLAKIGATFKQYRGDWSKCGYVLIPTKTLATLWESEVSDGSYPSAVSSMSFQDVAERTRFVELVPVGHKHLLDLDTASGTFFNGVERARDGAAANLWGAQFELTVQEVIDAGPWRPRVVYRSLIGKTIRHAGNAVTDIDAVAEIDGHLVLIDAKSHAATDRYLDGEYSAVKTFRERVEQEHTSWTEKVTRIAENPTTLALNTSESLPIVGILVTGFVPYLHPGPATAITVGGLRAVSSLDELMVKSIPAAFGAADR